MNQNIVNVNITLDNYNHFKLFIDKLKFEDLIKLK